MKTKFSIICIVLLFFSGATYAQDTIKGKVVDRKGNPVVGTKITLKSGDIATTDFNGVFEIEATNGDKAVANCVGMKEKKVRMSDDMVIKLSKSNGGNRKPTSYRPFIMLQGGISLGPVPVIGIKGGMVKYVGWYGKILVSTNDWAFKTITDVNDIEDNRHGNPSYYWTNGGARDYSSGWIRGHREFTAGGIVRLGCPLHFCAGIGVASVSECVNLVPDASGKTHTALLWKGTAFLCEAALMLSFKHFTMDFSVSFSPYGRERDIQIEGRYNSIVGGVEFSSMSFGFGYKF